MKMNSYKSSKNFTSLSTNLIVKSIYVLGVLTLMFLTSCSNHESDRAIGYTSQASSGNAKEYAVKEYAPPSSAKKSASRDGKTQNTTASPSDKINEQILDDNADYYDRKIIKTADYRIEVADIQSSTQAIRNVVARHDGFIANMDLSNNSRHTTTSMTIRIPNNHFNSVLDAINKEAVATQYKRIKSDDISEEFVDIQSRLETKKEVKKRYTELLRKKAENLEEVLMAEEKIRRLQEEIDSREGRLRYLENQSSLSTIQLAIYAPITQPIKEEPDYAELAFAKQLKDALMVGWTMITEIILMLATIWPLLLLLSLLFFWKGRWILAKFK